MVGAMRHGSHAEGARAAADGGGAAWVASDREGEQRACGSSEASDGAAGGGRRGDIRGGVARGRLSERRGGHVSGAALQSGRAGRARDRGWAWAADDLRRGGTGPDRGDRPAAAGSEGRWHRHVVALDPGADGASGGAPARGRDDDPTGAARRGQFVPADADVVPDRDGPAEARGGCRAGGGSADGRKKGAIDLAYRLAEAAGIPLWCQDEAGPYQAIPQAGAGQAGAPAPPLGCQDGAGPYQATPRGGAGGAPVGEPARLPHEYVRGGTA